MDTALKSYKAVRQTILDKNAPKDDFQLSRNLSLWITSFPSWEAPETTST